uniref:Uncharacterized protein n=1 Tax=Clandestinovirus TaxID=2831644 RepID=A0A8F8KQD8_9VIRU|nr:hypothetical protein KOM_12_4 [Clandestinovirus]
MNDELFSIGSHIRPHLTNDEPLIAIPTKEVIDDLLAFDPTIEPSHRVVYPAGSLTTDQSPLINTINPEDIISSETAYLDKQSLDILHKKARLVVLQRNCMLLEKTQRLITTLWWKLVVQCQEAGLLADVNDPEFNSALQWESLSSQQSNINNAQRQFVDSLKEDVTIFQTIKKV